MVNVLMQVMELKNKCDAVEKRESEKRQLDDKKHQEELQALKKTNQQLKVRHLCNCVSLTRNFVSSYYIYISF